MKPQRRLRTAPLALALALATAVVAAAADTPTGTTSAGATSTGATSTGAGGSRWQVAEAKVTVSGTSTLHDWTATAVAVNGTQTVPSGLLDGPPAAGAPTGSFSIAVAALQSGKERMDRLMHEALGAPEHPRISFELRRAHVTGAHPSGGLAVAVTGVMTVAGKPREVTVPMQVRRDGDRLRASGRVGLAMTDFGVTPPTAMMGTLHTGDAIEVALEAVLKPAP